MNKSWIGRSSAATFCFAAWLCVWSLLSTPHVLAAEVPVPLTPDRWSSKGDVEFSVTKQNPLGVMDVKKGSALLKGLTFENGTIDFDIKPVGHGVVGIKFRQSDDFTADVFFLRPAEDCATSFECIQYMPFSHGIYQWDLFPEYEGPAPVHATDWNHVRLVISGMRMNVFINQSKKPNLVVGRLEGGALQGALRLHGPATYANLVVSPNRTHGLSPVALPDPTASDPRYPRNWQVSPVSTLASVGDRALGVPTGKDPEYDRMPHYWSSIPTERAGLVNLTRRFGSKSDPTISVAWLKSTIISDRDQKKRVSIGWAREVWVYVNGKLVFADKNLYGTPKSKSPEGRVALENGSFLLPLKRGKNELAIAIDDNFSGGAQHFGWGLKCRLADVRGVRFVKGPE